MLENEFFLVYVNISILIFSVHLYVRFSYFFNMYLKNHTNKNAPKSAETPGGNVKFGTNSVIDINYYCKLSLCRSILCLTKHCFLCYKFWETKEDSASTIFLDSTLFLLSNGII